MQRCISNNGVPRRLRCDQAQTIRAKKKFFFSTNNIKLFFAPVDDQRAIGVVERMNQTLKRRLVVMKIDKTNTPYNLACDVAEIKKTLRITPHGVRKISPFEAYMGRKPNTPLSNEATTSSPNNLNWESTKHAWLDRKNLTKPPLPAERLHDLQRWSKNEVFMRRQETKLNPQMPKTLQIAKSPPQQHTGANSKVTETNKDRLNVRYKRVQATIDKSTKKRINQVARKTIRLATKVKDPKKIRTKI